MARSIVGSASGSTKRNSVKSVKPQNKPRGWIYGARWAGVPCEARPVWVTVGVAPADWWCRDLVGAERRAVEVVLEGQTVYIDNEDGRALKAFLAGVAPLPKFRFIPAFSVHDDPSTEVFYKAKVV